MCYALDKDKPLKKNENRFNFNLKPKSLSEYVGAENIKKIINISISAVKKSNITLGHILIMGQRGTGKTTLAELICKELHATPRIIGAGAIKTIADLNSLMLFGIPDDGYGFLIIDEIHNLPVQISDLLHSAMDEFTYSYSDAHHNIKNIDTPRFSILGCTTEEGKLSSPFRSRFRKQFFLEPYTPLQLQSMIMAVAKNNKISIDSDAAYEIAIRSQNIPRNAIVVNLLNVYEFALQTDGKINSDVVSACMDLHQIDERGLSQQHRLILKSLDSKPLGIQNIAQRTGISETSILKDYEPYLIQIGFIERIPVRGRILTELGRKYKNSII